MLPDSVLFSNQLYPQLEYFEKYFFKHYEVTQPVTILLSLIVCKFCLKHRKLIKVVLSVKAKKAQPFRHNWISVASSQSIILTLFVSRTSHFVLLEKLLSSNCFFKCYVIYWCLNKRVLHKQIV